MDLDKVLVMDKGEVIEYDTPISLLNNPTGIFSKMVNATGEN